MKRNLEGMLSSFPNQEEWVRKANEFLKGNVELLSETPGCYEAWNLLAELKIRLKSIEEAGIAQWGFDSLIKQLEHMPPSSKISNYVFEKNGKSGIFYVASSTQNLLGVVIVEVFPKVAGPDGPAGSN